MEATFYTSPGVLDERMYLYLATSLTAGEPSPEPGEEVRPMVTTWEEALEMAKAIASNGPLAVRSALEVIRKTPDMTYENALDLEYEKAVCLITSGECVHGITAFISKEKPEFPEPRC